MSYMISLKQSLSPQNWDILIDFNQWHPNVWARSTAPITWLILWEGGYLKIYRIPSQASKSPGWGGGCHNMAQEAWLICYSCLFPPKPQCQKNFSQHAAFLHSVQFSPLVMSDSLQPHESQHARPPCPLPSPGVHSNSCPSSRWCHPAISSSVVPFSSCPQSLPASESFPMNQLFTWGGQSTGVSALASFLPKNSLHYPFLNYGRRKSSELKINSSWLLVLALSRRGIFLILFSQLRCKLAYIRWIKNKVLLYITGNYIQHPLINHNGKEYNVYTCTAESLCCTAEINTTL